MEGIIANCKNTDGGKATALLVEQALRNKKIFVFGELLALSAVQKMKGTPEFDLLEIFAYGMYSDYIAKKDRFEGLLSAAQLYKLRQLTLVTLSTTHKTLSYDLVLQQVGLTQDREVEDLMISCVYDDLIKATCNPLGRSFQIQWVVTSRDVRREVELENMITKLENWLANAESMTQTLDRNLALYMKEREQDVLLHKLIVDESERVKSQLETVGDVGIKKSSSGSAALQFMASGRRQ